MIRKSIALFVDVACDRFLILDGTNLSVYVKPYPFRCPLTSIEVQIIWLSLLYSVYVYQLLNCIKKQICFVFELAYIEFDHL